MRVNAQFNNSNFESSENLFEPRVQIKENLLNTFSVNGTKPSVNWMSEMGKFELLSVYCTSSQKQKNYQQWKNYTNITYSTMTSMALIARTNKENSGRQASFLHVPPACCMWYLKTKNGSLSQSNAGFVRL